MTGSADIAAGPLSGVRVLDLTLALAGPLCTQRLGDMGAEIIKVEGPERPDFTRNATMRGVRLGGETTCYLSINRNKKSVAINLKTGEGREALMRLVARSDVVIQNMRPGAAARLGIDFESLKAANPRIVYVGISGYGSEGPLAAAPGQDLLVQSFSGTAMNGGVAGGLPHPAPIYVVDVAASHNACEAVLAGIIQRDRHGVAVEAEVSLLAAVLEIQIQEITTYMTTGRAGPRGETPSASTYMDPPYGVYRVRDGFVALAQADVAQLAEVLDDDAMRDLAAAPPDDGDEAAVAAWRDGFYRAVQAAIADGTRADIVARLSAEGVWAGTVQDYDELIAHPQAEGLFTTLDHPRAGALRTLAPAIRFSTQTDGPMAGAPALGEHTAEVLGTAGYDAAEIAALAERGIIR